MVRARISILIAALLWSTGGAAIKLSGLSGWQLAAGRSLVAACVLFGVVRQARALPSWRILRVGVAYAATVILFVLANKLTTAANAIFIQDSAPLWVVLLSPWLLRERPSRGELWAMPLFFGGLALFFVDELGPGQLQGNVLALLSGFSFAFSILGLRQLGEDGPRALVWGNVTAAVICAPFAVGGPVPTVLDLALVLFLGVFQLGLSYWLFTWGLLRVRAVEASLLVLLEPVLNPMWAFLLTRERPGPWALAGGGVILLATAWRTLSPSAPPPVAREAGAER